MAGNQSLEVLGPIPLFLETGKPFQLATQLIRSGERQKQQILTDATRACANSVELGTLPPDKAAKRFGALLGLDDSDDHARICSALEEVDRENPEAVEKIVSNLPATKLLQLDPTTGPSAELLIDYATPTQLATIARYYTEKIFAAKTREDRVVKRNEFDLGFPDEDSILPNHDLTRLNSKVNDAARGLGRLLDMAVTRGDEDNDGFLESFGTALLEDQSITSKKKTGNPTPPGFMIDEIIDMATRRSSAARVIESLPDGDPDGWDAKLTLRRNIT